MNMITPKALSRRNDPSSQRSKMTTAAVRFCDRADQRQRHQQIEPEEGGAEHDARDCDRGKSQKIQDLAARNLRLVHEIGNQRDNQDHQQQTDRAGKIAPGAEINAARSIILARYGLVALAMADEPEVEKQEHD